MKKILFIRGYNTDMNSTKKDSYCNFSTFFELSKEYKLKYFNYSPEEELDEVYKRLCKTLSIQKYDILIGHSMGGGLLLKYLTENKKKIKKYDKLLFLMPLVSKVPSTNILTKIPFSEKLYLPKALILPNNNLFDLGNILNDNYKLLCVKQVVTMYNDNKYISSTDLTILNKKNCHLVYAKNEKFTIIQDDVLDKIKNKTILEGKHEMFNEFDNSRKFFPTLKHLLLH